MARGRGASRLRFRLVPTVLLTLAIIVLPTVVYAWGRSSSSFTIDKVVVSGSKRVPEERLQRLLRRDYIGRNLFTVTSADVRKTFGRVSYVAAVSVDRDFPATLRVRVEEHIPVASVLAGNRWYAVSTEGFVIRSIGVAERDAATTGESAAGDGAAGGVPEADGEVGAGSPAASPSPEPSPSAAADGAAALDDGAIDADAEVQTADELAELREGPPGSGRSMPRLAAAGVVTAGRELGDPDARLAVAVVAGMPQTLRERVAVAVAENGWVTLRFSDGLEAVWGSGERSLAKGKAMRLVLEEYEKKAVRCTYIDVSAPDRVLARPVLE
jgi:cell division septal protein FtsQ